VTYEQSDSDYMLTVFSYKHPVTIWSYDNKTNKHYYFASLRAPNPGYAIDD